jgi:hypothetical protein
LILNIPLGSKHVAIKLKRICVLAVLFIGCFVARIIIIIIIIIRLLSQHVNK